MNTPEFTNSLLDIQERLYQFAYRLTGNQEEARDLLQETSFTVLNNEQLYAQGTNFSAWCHTIMRNLFTNQYRKLLRERTYCEAVIKLSSLSDISVDTSSNTSEIMQVLNSLPVGQRESFILHFSGFKYREIAEKMNLPIGTVKSRIHESKKSLQRQLQDFL